MAVDLLGLGISMLRCLGGSAVGFMVSKGIRSAAAEGGGSIRTFLQKDIDHIREKIDSLAQSKLSAALQNVRQGLILLDQQFSIAAPICGSASSSASDIEGAVSICVTTRAVLAAENTFDIGADVRHQFEMAQQLAVEAFHDKRNVPAMSRVECLKLQLFCAMLIHHQTPERWLGLWTVILEELTKDKELATAASAACEIRPHSPSSAGKKSALAVFWRKSNTDLSQAMYNLVENLHCALIAALWHPNVDARVAFGRSRLLQYPRILLGCSAVNQNSPSSLTTLNLDAPFLYPWRADRVVVVIPYVFKLLSLYPTNKILSAQIRPVTGANSNGSHQTSCTLQILDTLSLSEDETLRLEDDIRLLDLDFDRQALNVMILCSTVHDGRSVISYNLQFEKISNINLSFPSLCSQLVCDPVSGAVITFEGTSPDQAVYVLKNSSEITNTNWASYENIFKCMLADRPGSIRVAYAKPFRETFGDGETSFESGVELLLYNRFTDVVYSLVTSGSDDNGSSTQSSVGSIDGVISSVTSITMTDEESITKVQQIYPLKTPLLKVRVFDDSNVEGPQKVMLEEGGIFEHDHLAWAKEKCLSSTACSSDELLDKSSSPVCLAAKETLPALVGAYVANDDASTLNVFEAARDETQNGDVGLRFKTSDELQLPLLCEQWEDKFLGGVVCVGKFVFVGALLCKIKMNEN